MIESPLTRISFPVSQRLRMNTRTTSKGSRISRVLMTALTILLIFLFLDIMSLVADIQGTARVVNYAGLVRGTTQRIVKMEDAGLAQDKMIESVNSYIDGLRYGSDDLDLVRLDDEAYQAKMTELANRFAGLRTEIELVRETGSTKTPTSSRKARTSSNSATRPPGWRRNTRKRRPPRSTAWKASS